MKTPAPLIQQAVFGMPTQDRLGESAPLVKTLSDLDSQLRHVFPRFAALLLLINFLGCLFVIRLVHYTEIDWETYMIQVSQVLDLGERNYRNISGPTGPLVYPAAHVYLYSALYHVTSRGNNIQRAQYIFAVFHTLALGIMLQLHYTTRRLPLYMMPILFMSRRIVSLFVLRLFNDAFQTIPLYTSLLLFTQNRWILGCLFYSFAVGVKMNALLYAPGLAIILCQSVGFLPALLLAFLIFIPVQVFLGAPFLINDAFSYFSRAFELTRKFLYKWSVNGAFLPENIFTSSTLSVLLLCAHISALLVFAQYRWTPRSCKSLLDLIHPSNWIVQPRRRLNPTHVLFVLLSSNFIGIVFARTLHYQFYVWYAHSVPFLLWKGPFPKILVLLLTATVEVVFNVYPPHPLSAAVLNIAHFLILLSMFSERQATEDTIFEKTDDDRNKSK